MRGCACGTVQVRRLSRRPTSSEMTGCLSPRPSEAIRHLTLSSTQNVNFDLELGRSFVKLLAAARGTRTADTAPLHILCQPDSPLLSDLITKPFQALLNGHCQLSLHLARMTSPQPSVLVRGSISESTQSSKPSVRVLKRRSASLRIRHRRVLLSARYRTARPNHRLALPQEASRGKGSQSSQGCCMCWSGCLARRCCRRRRRGKVC